MRGGASTRRHPNRRASTDHKPGPNIARAPPMVPSRRATHRSPASVRICQISIKATNVPAMGVHRPGIRRIPEATKSAQVIVVFIGGSFHSVEVARTTSAEPTTTRMRSKPAPGQPPANVEYRRRNEAPFWTLLDSGFATVTETPKRVVIHDSFECCGFGGKAGGN